MKLRLETGNFTIKETYDEGTDKNKYAPLPTGLKPIDFIGSVICYSVDGLDYFNTVINASTEPGYPHVVDFYYLEGEPRTVYYNSLNGKVSENKEDVIDDSSSDEGGSDDSGSGGGGK